MPQMMRLTSNSIPDASIRRGPGENTPTIATTTQYFHQAQFHYLITQLDYSNVL
jgi:hypothetical protein